MTPILEDLETLRGEIERTKEEIAWTRDARLPKTEVAIRVQQCVDLLASEVDLAVYQAAEPGTIPISAVRRWLTPKTSRIGIPKNGPMAVEGDVLAAPLLAWLFGPEIKKKLVKAVEAADYVAGLPDAERPSRLIELNNCLRDLEMREEAAICAAEEIGLDVFRRHDCNPEIVLRIGDENMPESPPRAAFPVGATIGPRVFDGM